MRARPLVVTTLALVAVLWPLVRSPQSDGFPLSNYPMFTELRPRLTTIDIAVGLDSTGADVQLDPSTIGGSIEVIHAAATVEAAITAGETDVLCRDVAARVADGGPDAATHVVVVTDTYDTVAALSDDAPAVDRVEHARCRVER